MRYMTHHLSHMKEALTAASRVVDLLGGMEMVVTRDFFVVTGSAELHMSVVGILGFGMNERGCA